MTDTDSTTERALYNVYLEPTHRGSTLVSGVFYRPNWNGIPKGMTGRMVSAGQNAVKEYMGTHNGRHPEKGVHVTMDEDGTIDTRIIE